jgi:hypothetical protein
LASLTFTQKYRSLKPINSSSPFYLHFGKEPTLTVPSIVHVYAYLSKSSSVIGPYFAYLWITMSVLAKLMSITSLNWTIFVPIELSVKPTLLYKVRISSDDFNSW